MRRQLLFGAELKALTHLFCRLVEEPLQRQIEEMTVVQCWIIAFLYDNRERDIFQRDLETAFHIRRSTVTGILQGMERRGLIRREVVEHDARLKKLVLTDMAYGVHNEVEARVLQVENRAMDGIREEEMAFFIDILERMKKNLTE